jgi:dTDP-4-dehydrorhamnose reductase
MSGIVVLGGTGLVGNALLRAWEKRGERVSAATYRIHQASGFLQLDMRDEARVAELLGSLKPRIVAVPAANPYVDYCETHPEETRSVNVDGTLNVARACEKIGARMVFFSSDYVFDGVKGVYSEDDPPSPINEYGRQKAETERQVLQIDPANLVIRTSGAYGWQWEPKNFVLQILGRLGRGERMKVVKDLRYNPTYVENLAAITVALAEAGARGVFHAVGADEISRHEFALRAARAFGLDASLIDGVSSSEFRSPTPRPKESSLKTDKVRTTVAVQPIGVDEGLRAMKAMEHEWKRYASSLPNPAGAVVPGPR